MKNNHLEIPRKRPLADDKFNNVAVPLSPQLIRPYGGNTLQYKKRIFNCRLTRARSIECTYALNFTQQMENLPQSVEKLKLKLKY